MADDYPISLTNSEVADALRSHGSGVHSTVSDLADAIESADGPTTSDLGVVFTETLELLRFLADTIGPGVGTDDYLTDDDYENVSTTAKTLIERLDPGIERSSEPAYENGTR